MGVLGVVFSLGRFFAGELLRGLGLVRPLDTSLGSNALGLYQFL